MSQQPAFVAPDANPRGHFDLLFWSGVALLTALFVFVLPLFVPVRDIAGISASYLAGFNNSFAALSAAAISFAVFILRQRSSAPVAKKARTSETSSWTFTFVVIAFSGMVQAIWGFLVVSAHERYLGDAGYLIEQATVWLESPRHLYSQIEFAYGPLLVLPQAWLAVLLHVSVTSAYFLVLVIESAVGLLMVAWLLHQLPVRSTLRRAAILLFALAALTPHLGLNYTFFRFASPLFLLLFASRLRRSVPATCVWFAAALLLQLAVSPELALALLAGMAFYCSCRCFQDGRLQWLLPLGCAAATLLLSILTFERGYLAMVSTFARGVYNLPVGPYPHVLFLLAATVWVVPQTLARHLRRATPESCDLLGLYGVSLALLPAALGRCDPLHVLFNGVGMLCLALVGVSAWTATRRTLWIVAFSIVVLWEQRVNYAFFSWRTAETVQRALLPRLPRALRAPTIFLASLQNRSARSVMQAAPVGDPHLDLGTLNEIVGNAPVITPLEVTPTVENDLKESRHYAPLYHAFSMDIMDRSGEEKETTEINPFRWMLLPSATKLSTYQQTPSNIGPLQGMRMYFTQRRPVLFTPGSVFEAYVQQSWTPIHRFGDYVLYEHKGRSPSP